MTASAVAESVTLTVSLPDESTKEPAVRSPNDLPSWSESRDVARKAWLSRVAAEAGDAMSVPPMITATARPTVGRRRGFRTGSSQGVGGYAGGVGVPVLHPEV